MQKARHYIAGLFLVACTIIVIPKPLLHALTDHQDTIDAPFDHHFPGSHTHVEQQHTHCAIWQLELAPNLTTAFLHRPFYRYTFKTFDAIFEGRLFRTILFTSCRLRAPPLN